MIAGKRHVLKCLLQIYELMKDDERHYVLNELYINDYIIWTQFAKLELNQIYYN